MCYSGRRRVAICDRLHTYLGGSEEFVEPDNALLCLHDGISLTTDSEGPTWNLDRGKLHRMKAIKPGLALGGWTWWVCICLPAYFGSSQHITPRNVTDPALDPSLRIFTGERVCWMFRISGLEFLLGGIPRRTLMRPEGRARERHHYQHNHTHSSSRGRP